MKLIIINGPCGIGKSTLAAKIHANMKLSFLLDIDAQRRYISCYSEHPVESGKMISTISSAIIKNCLENKQNVIVDKMTFDLGTLDSYCELAAKCGADICEIILWAPRAFVMRRADERGWRDGGLLTPEKCDLFWHKIDKIKDQRNKSHIINVENKTEDELYAEVCKIIADEDKSW